MIIFQKIDENEIPGDIEVKRSSPPLPKIEVEVRVESSWKRVISKKGRGSYLHLTTDKEGMDFYLYHSPKYGLLIVHQIKNEVGWYVCMPSYLQHAFGEIS